jgi:hypothetical protein
MNGINGAQLTNNPPHNTHTHTYNWAKINYIVISSSFAERFT